jgi:hypothetical protein
MLHGFKTWQELTATSPSEYHLVISILFAKAHRFLIQTAKKTITWESLKATNQPFQQILLTETKVLCISGNIINWPSNTHKLFCDGK